MDKPLKKVIIVRDDETEQIFGVYDISNMSGELIDYYDGNFDSYEEYEADMINRGAVNYIYETHDI